MTKREKNVDATILLNINDAYVNMTTIMEKEEGDAEVLNIEVSPITVSFVLFMSSSLH